MVEIRYASDHEWIRIDEDGTASVGISEYAQAQLGDIVHLELPEVGCEIVQNEEIGLIESISLIGDLKAPVNGTVVALNESLNDYPGLINDSPLDDGWILKIEVEDEAEASELMTEDRYADYPESLG